MGIPIHYGLHNPFLILMGHPQIYTLLVLIHHQLISCYDLRVVAVVHVGGAGGGAWTYVDGGRLGNVGARYRGGVVHHACAAYLMWEVTEGGVGGGKEIDG
ncbi:hypothetical protein Vadar_021906 [Vaccinium darrowii]|uniref:Uncharacterized protein n=1 Tax=Vaccinium darrowii TaxID=229202 RepID=A0ACB7Y9T9_9ERIC|nr:hypothetical protein Vadar_021906 [Vaccinium darrowii]